MSLIFSDTTNYRGILQQIEDELSFERGYITNNISRLKSFTALINLAWDDYVYLALKSSGAWQWDDSNFSDYPIIKTNIVSGQRDYTFTTDEGNNLILDIYKVAILTSETATLYEEIDPIDQQKRGFADDITAENTVTGMPYQYDKTANGIFLDPIPNYNKTNGLKVYINREPSYFNTTDTTKKPGCPGIHHRFFVIKPALDYARRNNLDTYTKLREEVVSFEGDEEKGIMGKIERYFGRRSKDDRAQITMKKINYI